MQSPSVLTYCLILFSVAASAVAQLLLKVGMSQAAVPDAESVKGTLAALMWGAQNVWVVGGLGLYFFSALVWLKVLAKVDLSFAYPFVGLGFVMTMLLGKIALDETVSTQRFVGTLCIVLGILFIAMDKNR